MKVCPPTTVTIIAEEEDFYNKISFTKKRNSIKKATRPEGRFTSIFFLKPPQPSKLKVG